MSKSELKWNILLEQEKSYQAQNILTKFLKVKKCPNCKSNNINLANGQTIFNPFISLFIKFKKILYLRHETIYNYFPKTLISVLQFIIELFNEDNNNAINICEKI